MGSSFLDRNWKSPKETGAACRKKHMPRKKECHVPSDVSPIFWFRPLDVLTPGFRPPELPNIRRAQELSPRSWDDNGVVGTGGWLVVVHGVVDDFRMCFLC